MDLKQFVKYVISGGTAFCVEFAGFYLLTQFLPYIAANIIVYSFTFWFSFLVNKYWTFGSRGNLGKQLRRYIVLYCINLVLTNTILYLLVSAAGLSEYLGKVIVAGMLVCWNFVLYRKIIYV